MNKDQIKIADEVISADPIIQFSKWYDKRLSLNLSVPNTMSLATISGNGSVSVRTLLLKGFDENGFVFFTNYESRKGKQLEVNPSAALLFYWPESGQQVRIEGSVTKVSQEESDIYFKSRPRESRISAWASGQSTVIPDRAFLDDRFTHFKNFFKDKEVPRPQYWGGYCLTPSWIEFWKEGEHRMHDRITYTRNGTGWVINRLSP